MKIANEHISDILMRCRGIDVSIYDDSFLTKSIMKRMSETECDSIEEYCILLEETENEGNRFFDSLHISYSEFFRNPLTFAVLENILLPSLLLKKRKGSSKEIRIWSAACASGQEVYSLAILLEELLSDSVNISYRIFATDSSEYQINEAMKGEYSSYELNKMNLKRLNQNFTKNGDRYALNPILKEKIDFSIFDLLNGEFSSPPASIYGDFDLIICANLLFYYKPASRKIILNKIYNSLSKEGLIITGETEREILLEQNNREVYMQSAIFQPAYSK